MLRSWTTYNHRHDRRERTALYAVLATGARIRIDNLSLGGALLQLPTDELKPGAIVDFALLLGDRPLGIRSVIRRQEARCYGVQFLAFEPGGFERLEKFLLHRRLVAA